MEGSDAVDEAGEERPGDTRSSSGQASILRRPCRSASTNSAPFVSFSHLRFYDSVEALTATYPASRPKLVLAIPPSMSHGPSRSLFTQYADNTRTLVVLTSRGVPGTLGGDLFEMWNSRQERGRKAGEGAAGKPIEVREKMDLQVSNKPRD